MVTNKKEARTQGSLTTLPLQNIETASLSVHTLLWTFDVAEVISDILLHFDNARSSCVSGDKGMAA